MEVAPTSLVPSMFPAYHLGMNPLLDRPAVVYKVTNTVNGKFYIGVTGNFKQRKALHLWTVTSERRGHAPIYKAMRKYGTEAFVWEIIANFRKGSRALATEKRLIQTLRPHYNATPGGEGFTPSVISPEGRRRISETHKGKQYRLGIPHSDETKRLLRKAGIRNRAKWLERNHLGPQATAKRVVCLDDGLVYDSIADAARTYNLKRSAINEVCLRRAFRRTAGGRVFRFEGDHHQAVQQIKEAHALTRERKAHAQDWKKLPVQCLDDGQIFPGALEAARFYGLKDHARYMIGEVCRGKPGRDGKTARSVAGRRFRYISGGPGT